MSSSRIITGNDIVSYLPASFSQEQNSKVITLTEQIRYHIAHQLPIAFGYDGIHRMTVPGSLYLQKGTRGQYAKITHPTYGHPYTMSVESPGARRAVGFDGLELVRGRDEDVEQWKTYHLDKIDNLELYTCEQVAAIFGDFDRDRVAHLSQTIPGFCKNWNYDFRRIMIEREGKNDCKVPAHFYK